MAAHEEPEGSDMKRCNLLRTVWHVMCDGRNIGIEFPRRCDADMIAASYRSIAPHHRYSVTSVRMIRHIDHWVW